MLNAAILTAARKLKADLAAGVNHRIARSRYAEARQKALATRKLSRKKR
jgi:hypothetical protein